MKTRIAIATNDGVWGLTVKGEVTTVTFEDGDNYDNMTYGLPSIPKEVEYSNTSGMHYVYVTFENGSMYQFKFEDGGNLIGDSFGVDGEHIEPIAMHTFGEDWD
jgi:hypothetical protein